MTEEEAAAFLIGEGSFGYSMRPYFRPYVQAEQMERQPLDQLAALFGGNVYQRPSRPIFIWALYGNKALDAMRSMRPSIATISPRRLMQIDRVLNAAREYLAERVCRCGTNFVPRVHHQKHCSRLCSQHAHRARLRDGTVRRRSL